MAYVRSYETKQKRNGKRVKTYQVVWREAATNANGLPIPNKHRTRSEAYRTSEAAHARCAELNAAKHTTGTTALADQRKAGNLTFRYYAQAWLSSQRVKAASGKVKPATVDGYAKRLAVYALPAFGPRSIASITPADCEQFLAPW